MRIAYSIFRPRNKLVLRPRSRWRLMLKCISVTPNFPEREKLFVAKKQLNKFDGGVYGLNVFVSVPMTLHLCHLRKPVMHRLTLPWKNVFYLNVTCLIVNRPINIYPTFRGFIFNSWQKVSNSVNLARLQNFKVIFRTVTPCALGQCVQHNAEPAKTACREMS
jgi:hypothetical protein